MERNGTPQATGFLPFVLTDRGYVLTSGSATVRPATPRLLGPRATRLAVGDAFEPRVPSVASVSLPDGTAADVGLEPERLGWVDLFAVEAGSYGARLGLLMLVLAPLLSLGLALASVVHVRDDFGGVSLERLTGEIREMADDGRGGFQNFEVEDGDASVIDLVKGLSKEGASGR